MKLGQCGIRGVFASVGLARVAIGGWVDAFSLRCGAPEDGCMLNTAAAPLARSMTQLESF
ncbi:hypothetical protein I7V34_20650 [Bacillus sp. V3]|nr:hypothetical protein I7V34_20650 [Bacillus sp. V3]